MKYTTMSIKEAIKFFSLPFSLDKKNEVNQVALDLPRTSFLSREPRALFEKNVRDAFESKDCCYIQGMLDSSLFPCLIMQKYIIRKSEEGALDLPTLFGNLLQLRFAYKDADDHYAGFTLCYLSEYSWILTIDPDILLPLEEKNIYFFGTASVLGNDERFEYFPSKKPIFAFINNSDVECFFNQILNSNEKFNKTLLSLFISNLEKNKNDNNVELIDWVHNKKMKRCSATYFINNVLTIFREQHYRIKAYYFKVGEESSMPLYPEKDENYGFEIIPFSPATGLIWTCTKASTGERYAVFIPVKDNSYPEQNNTWGKLPALWEIKPFVEILHKKGYICIVPIIIRDKHYCSLLLWGQSGYEKSSELLYFYDPNYGETSTYSCIKNKIIQDFVKNAYTNRRMFYFGLFSKAFSGTINSSESCVIPDLSIGYCLKRIEELLWYLGNIYFSGLNCEKKNISYTALFNYDLIAMRQRYDLEFINDVEHAYPYLDTEHQLERFTLKQYFFQEWCRAYKLDSLKINDSLKLEKENRGSVYLPKIKV